MNKPRFSWWFCLIHQPLLKILLACWNLERASEILCPGSQSTKEKALSPVFTSSVVSVESWSGSGSCSSVGCKLFSVVAPTDSCFLQTPFTEDLLFLMLSLSSFCPSLCDRLWKWTSVWLSQACWDNRWTCQHFHLHLKFSRLLAYFLRLNSVE